MCFMQRLPPGGVVKKRRLDGGPTIFTFNYEWTYEHMLACGEYSFWQDVTFLAKYYPLVGTGIIQFEVKLFRFDRKLDLGEIEKEIRRACPWQPWRPGKIEHLLSFCADLPEQPSGHMLCAPGTMYDAGACPQILGVTREHNGGRHVLDVTQSTVSPANQYLGVRELSGGSALLDY